MPHATHHLTQAVHDVGWQHELGPARQAVDAARVVGEAKIAVLDAERDVLHGADDLQRGAILVVSTVLIARAAAKIYRVGVLMYGKRPGARELIRWLRY